MIYFRDIIFFTFIFQSTFSYSQNVAKQRNYDFADGENSFDNAIGNPYQLLREPERPRDPWLMPFLSLFLPGLDQWWEGQYEWAGIYSFSALAGVGYSIMNRVSYADHPSKEQIQDRMMHGVKERKRILGGQVYQGAGGLSAYHAFQTAVASRKQIGQFSFLSEPDKPQDIMMAPWNFSYAIQPTTYIPLLFISSIGVLSLQSVKYQDEYRKDSLSGDDVFYSMSRSYIAGTHEEAWFRGWWLPAFREATGSDFWANTGTAVVFGLAHYESNSRPWPQAILGWYLGWLTQKNNWSIRESVFIHTWWDVAAFLVASQIRKKEFADKKYASLEPPLVLNLPPLYFSF